MTRRWLLMLALLCLSACTAIVHGSPLSGRPFRDGGVYLSTGGSPRPYKTLGFVQVTGYGMEIAGALTAGDSGIDSVLSGSLADQAIRMGGDGVINISFLDTNPSTPAEKAQSALKSLENIATGTGGVESKNRTVVATGEVIAFLN